MDIGSASGINVGQLFQNATSGLAKDGAALQAKMDQLSAAAKSTRWTWWICNLPWDSITPSWKPFPP